MLGVGGHLELIDRCGNEFVELRILTGPEVGEPHRFSDRTAQLLLSGRFESVLGSLHTTRIGSDERLLDGWRSEVTTAEQDNAAFRSAAAIAEAVGFGSRPDP